MSNCIESRVQSERLRDAQLAEWLWKRLDRCLPCDDWQRDQLVTLARDLTETRTLNPEPRTKKK